MTYFPLDLNDTESPLKLIPAHTIVKVRLHIHPGGYGENKWLTKNQISGAIYLHTAFVVTEGPYMKQKIFHCIGIEGATRTEEGEDLFAMHGKALLRKILESAHGIDPFDASERAMQFRKLATPGILNGLVCLVKVGIEKDPQGYYPNRNKILYPITPDHKEYKDIMEGRIHRVSSRVVPHEALPNWMTE